MIAPVTREHVVAIGGQCAPVGIIRFGVVRDKQVSSFRYADDWLQSPEAFAIAPSLPLGDQWFHFSSQANDAAVCLHGAFSDCAPDVWGRGIMQRAADHKLNEFEYLLSVDDRTRQGALRFLDSSGSPLADDAPPTPRVVDVTRLQRLCADLEAGAGDLRQIALELLGASASLGGARPKSVVVDDGGALYVAKFTTNRDTMPIERAEVATLALARDAGIRSAKAMLAVPNSEPPVALIERFDRDPGGTRRRHYLSAQTFIGATRGEQRFYTDIAEGLARVVRLGRASTP